MQRQHLIKEGRFDSALARHVDRRDVTTSRVPQKESANVPEGLSAYLKAISQFPLLTKKDEQDLARRVRGGDAVVKERMVLANLRLVISIAKRYQGMGLPLADLIGEGNLGLIKAVDRFKYEMGFRFSTYASKWIRQAITYTLATDSRTVRLPANVIEILRKVKATEEGIQKFKREEPLESEVCTKLGLSSARYAEVSNASSTVSLESPCSADSEVCLHEVLPDETQVAPDDLAFEQIDYEKLDELLARLSERERFILSHRFGLEDGNIRTLAETGKMVGITRERIRQIEKGAIEKVRKMMRKRRMRRFLVKKQ